MSLAYRTILGIFVGSFIDPSGGSFCCTANVKQHRPDPPLQPFEIADVMRLSYLSALMTLAALQPFLRNNN